MTTSIRKLRACGYSDEQIALAHLQQEASRRAGATPRTILEILRGEKARPRPAAAPADLTARQLRRRGRYGQAALLVDQEALADENPDRAEQARAASATLKALAKLPERHQFDFFGGGNVTTAREYYRTIRERLKASGVTTAKRAVAHTVLCECIDSLKWQSYEVDATATEISRRLDMPQPNVSRTLALLEQVGAIKQIKRGRTNIITITPEGAYRGDINKHADAVAKYQAEVVPLRPGKTTTTRRTRTSDDPPPRAA